MPINWDFLILCTNTIFYEVFSIKPRIVLFNIVTLDGIIKNSYRPPKNGKEIIHELMRTFG